MTAVWTEADDKWELLTPAGFAAEEALHDLVARTPGLLPLAGSPGLAVVGREVWLGGNKADLVAIEATGRLCIIEVKLAANSEARRAVVAQVLSYAAFLHGMTVEEAADLLARPLESTGFASLADAAKQAGQDGSFDEAEYVATLRETLAGGGFRLVLVLDKAPPELVRTVGYLQTVAPKLDIDLVTVTAYQVGGRRVLVPQRVEPGRTAVNRPQAPDGSSGLKGTSTPGSDVWLSSIAGAPPEHQSSLRRLGDWALDLEQRGLASLASYVGVRDLVTLLPLLEPEKVGLVTVWNWKGAPAVQFWRSVFLRRAPLALADLEKLIEVRQGNTISDVSDELLTLMTNAYDEASRTG